MSLRNHRRASAAGGGPLGRVWAAVAGACLGAAVLVGGVLEGEAIAPPTAEGSPPAVGTNAVLANQNAFVSASTFVACPTIWDFSSWTGPVADPSQSSTSIFMDGNKTITAHFVARTPVCNDACHPYPAMDFNHDCITNVSDFATFATDWLTCHQPGCPGY